MRSFAPDNTLNVPVLFVIFNRPDTTQLVFEAIRKVKPPRLYVAADGPRPHVESDIVQCTEARKIIEGVDWPCQVQTLFRETNAGCGVAMSSACMWFFEHEEEGIIMEDDCLPVPSFFWYCQELLEHYRHDTRVMHIGGNNFLNGWRKDHDYSYYFSRSGHIWGWATWRRAWQTYDFTMRLYDTVKRKNLWKRFFMNGIERLYRRRKLDETYRKRAHPDSWDYQWDFARYVQSGLAIVPEVNLVKNIGFDDRATHTRNGNSASARLETDDIEFPLRHPPFVIRDVESEKKYFKNFMTDVVRSKLHL